MQIKVYIYNMIIIFVTKENEIFCWSKLVSYIFCFIENVFGSPFKKWYRYIYSNERERVKLLDYIFLYRCFESLIFDWMIFTFNNNCFLMRYFLSNFTISFKEMTFYLLYMKYIWSCIEALEKVVIKLIHVVKLWDILLIFQE